MADQQRWFKLWCSSPDDDDIQALTPDLRWAWAALGCYTKVHGTRGTVIIRGTNSVLAAQMGVAPERLIETVQKLPHITVVNDTKSVNGKITVTFRRWCKYQEDNSLTRVKRHRSSKSVTPKKRREENKNKKRVLPPHSPPKGTDECFEKFWKIYPKKVGKGAARRSWMKLQMTQALLETIIETLSWQVVSEGWRRDSGKFVPNPATWLNQERWLDEKPKICQTCKGKGRYTHPETGFEALCRCQKKRPESSFVAD